MTHPLDPLSADEFNTVAGILRREHRVGSGWRFASIEMREPDKAELRAFDEHGTVPARRATVVCFQRAENATYKAVVSLTEDRVESFDHVPGVQSTFTVDEFVEMDTWTFGDAVAPPNTATAGWAGPTPGARTAPAPPRTRISSVVCAA